MHKQEIWHKHKHKLDKHGMYMNKAWTRCLGGFWCSCDLLCDVNMWSAVADGCYIPAPLSMLTYTFTNYIFIQTLRVLVTKNVYVTFLTCPCELLLREYVEEKKDWKISTVTTVAFRRNYNFKFTLQFRSHWATLQVFLTVILNAVELSSKWGYRKLHTALSIKGFIQFVASQCLFFTTFLPTLISCLHRLLGVH